MNEVKRNAVIYVDVDDTLAHHASTKAIPIPRVIEQVRRLHALGFSLYCWCTGGADYARRVATELDVAGCFVAFLPKPTLRSTRYCRSGAGKGIPGEGKGDIPNYREKGTGLTIRALVLAEIPRPVPISR